MPCKVRGEYPGAIYHVLSRADGQGDIVLTDVEQRPKSEARQLAMATRLRRETTLTLRQNALRLHMGRWKSLISKLYRWTKTTDPDRGSAKTRVLTPSTPTDRIRREQALVLADPAAAAFGRA